MSSEKDLTLKKWMECRIITTPSGVRIILDDSYTVWSDVAVACIMLYQQPRYLTAKTYFNFHVMGIIQ